MTVRNITKTTVSVIISIIGFVFLRLYYVGLLSRLIKYTSDNNGYSEEYSSIIGESIGGRLLPNEYIGAYYTGLFYFCVMIIIAVCLIDVILCHKVALNLLSSFVLPLVFTAIVTITLCIVKINILQLWAIFYGFLIICLHSILKRLLLHSESVGSYANLKLIKGFFLTIKDTIVKLISTGKRNFNNPIDEITILSVSSLVLLLEAISVISYIIYLNKYWRLIFLSRLINIF